jgi:type II secretory pathway pseudopilin PulG
MRLPRFRLSDKLFSAASLAIIGAAAVLMIAGVSYYIQQERNRKAIEEQTSTTNQLIEEVKTLTLEVRNLSRDNKQISEQSRNYIYCNAVLFAKYTQDQQPIVIEDLEKCLFTSFSQDRGGEQQRTSIQGGNMGQLLQPDASPQPSTGDPQTPRNPNDPEEPSNNILTIHDLLEINEPCLDVIGLIKTCSQ